MQDFISDSLIETKPQRWRAVAEMQNHQLGLICLGHNLGQVKENYLAAYEELFTKEAKSLVKKIRIERWDGRADCGNWRPQSYVPLPIKD